MRKFTLHKGVTAPLIRPNIDTDAIIPSVEMKRVSKKGLSSGLFAAWRYIDRVQRIPNPDFVLNQEAYQNASILLGGRNFGCGSSREHAVWALDEFGFRAIIAPSFGAIFRANCIANGLLPVGLVADDIDLLAEWVAKDPQANCLKIDLEQRSVTASPDQVFDFEMDESDAQMLLHGLDPIALTLRLEDQVEAFQQSDRLKRPWVYL